MKRLLLLLIVLAGGIAAAAFTVPGDVATINGQSISQSSIDAELSAISGSTQYQCALNAQLLVQSGGRASLPPVDGVGSGTYNTAFVSYWLTQQINDVLVQQLATQHGVVLTSAQLTSARNELLQSVQNTLSQVAGTQFACPSTADSVLASLPTSFSHELVTAQAYQDLLLSESPGSAVSEAALRRYFNRHSADFDTVCLSGIIVSSQATANQLRSQIQGGASFSQLAKTDSIDSASASNGGALGCFSPNSSTYSTIRRDIGSVQVGQVTQPISTSNGDYILLQPTARHPASFSAVRSAVRATLLAAGASHANAALEAAARQAQVSVDPSYGRWNPSTAARNVEPPQSPPISSVLSPSANQPSPPAQTGSSSGGAG